MNPFEVVVLVIAAACCIAIFVSARIGLRKQDKEREAVRVYSEERDEDVPDEWPAWTAHSFPVDIWLDHGDPCFWVEKCDNCDAIPDSEQQYSDILRTARETYEASKHEGRITVFYETTTPCPNTYNSPESDPARGERF